MRSESCSLLGAVTGQATGAATVMASGLLNPMCSEALLLRPLSGPLSSVSLPLTLHFCDLFAIPRMYCALGVLKASAHAVPCAFPLPFLETPAHPSKPTGMPPFPMKSSPSGSQPTAAFSLLRLHPAPPSANACVCPPSQRASSLPGHCSRGAGVPPHPTPTPR